MRVAIFGTDRYLRALLPAFVHFYEKFWPDNPWPTVIVSQTFVAEEFPTICTGPDETFSQQVLRFLEEHDREEPFLMLLDDYFLCRSVETAILVKCLEVMEVDPQVGRINVKIIGGDRPAWDYNEFLGEFNKRECAWLFQNQAVITRAGVMRDLTRVEEDGWLMEVRGSRRARNYPGRFLTVKKTAMEYVNYMGRAGPRKEGLEWLRENGMAPIYP